jgi:hypothetical protein
LNGRHLLPCLGDIWLATFVSRQILPYFRYKNANKTPSLLLRTQRFGCYMSVPMFRSFKTGLFIHCWVFPCLSFLCDYMLILVVYYFTRHLYEVSNLADFFVSSAIFSVFSISLLFPFHIPVGLKWELPDKKPEGLTKKTERTPLDTNHLLIQSWFP